jgi:signal transduction histidine kinase
MDVDAGSTEGGPSELERTVAELVTHALSVVRTQGRLRNLLDANRHIVERLDLPSTLRAVVEAGAGLVGARSGVLEVVGDEEATVRFDADPLDPDPGHVTPALGTAGAERPDLLVLPVVVRGTVYGRLVLSRPVRSRFTAEDEEFLVALTATAGVAIDNARLFDDARRREQWTTAIAEISAALLADTELEDVLTMIIDRVASFVDADLVCVAVPTSSADLIRISVATGAVADGVRGREIAVHGTLAGRAMRDGRSVASDDPVETRLLDGQPPLGPSIAIPLRTPGKELGALLVSRRPGTAPFSRAELTMADEFGRQTSVALAVSRGRRDRHRLELAEDRSRIARDLHDNVIQRLFASGLALQGIAPTVPAGLRPRIEEQVDAIDAAIGDIRTAVFALGSVARVQTPTTRDRLLEVVGEIAPALAVTPRITFSGPVDLDVHGALGDDVVAVVRESLTNVARHAPDASSHVTVAVTAGPVDDGTVSVVVDDDGPGPGEPHRRGGTANLAVRAHLRGGTFRIGGGPDGGTRVSWTTPLADPTTTTTERPDRPADDGGDAARSARR